MGLSIILIVFSQKSEFFHKISANLSLVVLPIQYLVNTPIKTNALDATNIITQQQLVADNARLHVHKWLSRIEITKTSVS
ncbi:hypothetical protein [Coxiella endosymbiont of Dermacentor marginatus]|uniref:hypothetical protein n=1 Tax=Coxiella endosymbiont of Dermacentor marginatus TaxID=1656159 RepID=UPI002223461A|nr:hypothetical protein [Coxiella endosymbiont of Dermacentor marginatus]